MEHRTPSPNLEETNHDLAVALAWSFSTPGNATFLWLFLPQAVVVRRWLVAGGWWLVAGGW
jgi:hypothetical protein